MMNNVFDLNGQTALVTGGSRGIGRAISRMLAEAGADVCLVSRDIHACKDIAEEIAERTGRRVASFQCDVSIPQSIELAIQGTIEKFGKIDVLINNAGIIVPKPLDQLTLEDFQKVFQTNVFGAFLVARSVVAQDMKPRRAGKIINIGSIAADFPRAELGAYGSSKAALHTLTKAMAIEGAPHNITVNAIAPGPVKTDLNASIWQRPELFKSFVERVPMGRWSEPDEIGALAVYLASDAAKFMTGSIVKIDGGLTLSGNMKIDAGSTK